MYKIYIKMKTYCDSLQVRHCRLDILQCHCSKHYVADTVPYYIGTCTMNNNLHIHIHLIIIVIVSSFDSVSVVVICTVHHKSLFGLFTQCVHITVALSSINLLRCLPHRFVPFIIPKSICFISRTSDILCIVQSLASLL